MFKVVIYFFISIVLFIALTITGAVTGAFFYIWPTSIPDQELIVTKDTLAELEHFRIKYKFGEEQKYDYPGAVDEASRLQLEQIVNILSKTLEVGLLTNPNKSFVLLSFKKFLKHCSEFDSEDQDMILNYMEEIMVILKIDSSNELLNVWRYGLPFGWFSSMPNRVAGGI
ncbi:DUF4844 domain-containing protein [Agarivorans sp. QJM3NY_29]|uniref:DUF4844 domain-containing protein n=1 Tax=unclassified Agarivorans TaxID=2636026 RepID=UPI003D7D8F33